MTEAKKKTKRKLITNTGKYYPICALYQIY